MLVSISKAADMVGITRATFYRHVDRKGISIQKDGDGNPKVDVSELIRVYGDKVRLDDPDRKGGSPDTEHTIQDKQDNTPQGSLNIAVEIGVLKERIQHLMQEREHSQGEREREREQLVEQIDMLRARLVESEAQQKRLTLLLTHSKEEGRKEDGKEDQEKLRIKNLEDQMQKILKQNQSILKEFQGRKQSWWARITKSG
jgi:hypothetical protein